MALPLGIFKGSTVPNLRQIVSLPNLRKAIGLKNADSFDQTEASVTESVRESTPRHSKLFSVPNLGRRLGSCFGSKKHSKASSNNEADLAPRRVGIEMAALFDDDDDELAWQTDDEISDSELHEDDTPVLQLTGRMGPPRPYRGQIQGIRINPRSVMEEENRQEYEVVMFDPSDSIFRLGGISLGAALKLQLIPKFEEFEDSDIRDGDLNMTSQTICIECSFRARDYRTQYGDSFGTLLANMHGPVTFVRQDKQHLHVLHLMALVAFVERNLFPDFLEYQRMLKIWLKHPLHFYRQHEYLIRRSQITQKITPAAFTEFWNKYKEDMVVPPLSWLLDDDGGIAMTEQQMVMFSLEDRDMEGHPEWRGVPSPYDVGKTESVLAREKTAADTSAERGSEENALQSQEAPGLEEDA